MVTPETRLDRPQGRAPGGPGDQPAPSAARGELNEALNLTLKGRCSTSSSQAECGFILTEGGRRPPQPPRALRPPRRRGAAAGVEPDGAGSRDGCRQGPADRRRPRPTSRFRVSDNPWPTRESGRSSACRCRGRAGRPIGHPPARQPVPPAPPLRARRPSTCSPPPRSPIGMAIEKLLPAGSRARAEGTAAREIQLAPAAPGIAPTIGTPTALWEHYEPALGGGGRLL